MLKKKTRILKLKILKTKASKSELSSTIDFSDDLKGLSRDQKQAALQEVGEFLVEQTLVNAAESASIVKGEKIPALSSKPYKLKKRDEVGNATANLELSGEMLDSVDYKPSVNSLTIGVYGDAALRADGHNNFSGKSSLPKRRIFPGEGQEYKSDVQKEIKRIISDYRSSNPIAKDFEDIQTKTELYDTLKEITGLTSRSEIKLAVMRSRDLLDVLDDLDLADLL